MSNWKQFASGAALSVMAAAIVQPAMAQSTTSGVRGVVTTADGAPATDATVTVVDTRNGSTRTSSTSSNGLFDVRNLGVGGPYTVTVEAPGQQPTRVEGVVLGLGSATDINLQFSGAATEDIIVVTASSDTVGTSAIGPSVTFSFSDIQNSPAINRDLKDIVRLDPRISLDEGYNDSISCAGANPRFNSLTVDGIGLNDGFGLNSNGYPTERMPFPFDAIENVSVELAPFDVQYGFFTGCNINAVTQSGGNEFHGSVFYDYTDDSFTGDMIDGASVAIPEFDEKRYGFTLGGPIIKDKLFFFAAYEKFEGVNVFGAGPEGSGAATEVAGLTQAELDDIRDISQTVYGFDPGDIPLSSPSEDEKYLARLDWNINDSHRASLTYNYNSGLNLTRSDDDNDELEFGSHFYNRGAELQAYSGQFFSDWSDNFSTEFRVAYNDVDFTQESQFGTDFGEVQIRDDDNNIIYLGADDSRHSNDLDYTVLTLKGVGTYVAGDHVFTFGGERTTYDIFNLFVQETEGEWRFDSIDDFRNQFAERVIYENAAGSNDPNDASATFAYSVNSLYVQDEWTAPYGVTLTGGLRYDWYSADDKPNFNQNFFDRYGYGNDGTLDGKSLLQPRIAFKWDADNGVSLRGGVGLFSGGNPNVWLSNSYSNNGITQVEQSLRGGVDLTTLTFVEDEGGQGRPIYGIPQSLYDAVANGAANSGVNALDPDFEIPYSVKTALGFTYDFDLPGSFGDGYSLNADFLYSRDQNAAIISDATLVNIGQLPDGRPYYEQIDRSDPDCLVDPTAAACTKRNFSGDYILTNASGGRQLALSASLSKGYDFGLDWSLGYAFLDAEDVNPMTSSVAFSNYANIAVSDPENPMRATSNYETPHNITMRVSYEKEFFGEYATRATLFGRVYQANPYSFTFTGDDGVFVGDEIDFRHLLYVPTENDPLVSYAPGFDVAAFNSYIAQHDLKRGAISQRNETEGSWSNKFDLRLEQELPGIMSDHRTKAFLVVENIGNLLNDEWGSRQQALGALPGVGVVEASYDAANNQYIYEQFSARDPETLVNDNFQSLWSVRFGLKYDF